MKKYFKEDEREKEKSKIIELSFGVNFDDIKENFEEVDPNGEEKTEEKTKNVEAPSVDKDTIKEIPTETDKKKKKKNKKK